MITPIILFLVGLVLLIKGGDWFVDGATGIAHRFHVPDLLIGATVVFHRHYPAGGHGFRHLCSQRPW